MNAPNPLSPDKHTEPKGYEPSMEEILASIRRIIADDQAFSQHPIPAPQSSAQAEPLSEPASAPEARAAQTQPVAESKPFVEPKPFFEPKPSIEPRSSASPKSLAELERSRGTAALQQASAESKPAAQSSGAPRILTARPPLTERRPLIKEGVAAPAVGAEGSPSTSFPVEAQFQVFKTALRPLTGAARAAENERHGTAEAEALAGQHEGSPNLAGAFLQGQLPERASDGGVPLVSPKTDATVASAFEALLASRFLQSSEGLNDIIREMARPMLKAWLDDNLPILVERLVRAEIERVARGGR